MRAPEERSAVDRRVVVERASRVVPRAQARPFVGRAFALPRVPGQAGMKGTMKPISVWVPGNPVTLTAPARVADPWKRAVSAAVRAQWTGGFLDDACAVLLDFSLTPGRYPTTAVYNLLKATVDGLSHVIFKPSPSGQPGPWSREDFWITQLVARKRMADKRPGVAIELRPPGADLTQYPEPPVIEAFIRGSPPLWPGDEAGQRKVEAWRTRSKAVLIPAVPPPSQTRLALAFRFQIEPERVNSSDLDNFCVPAAQAVVQALFGDLSRGPSVQEIAAEKVATSADNCGVAVQVRYI